MADSALEEKINKIRQQNEEIRRRYEEVEEDKKKAAKLNALVQMVPSTDWPERKEPPEFSNPLPRNIQKQKFSGKEHNESSQQYHVEGRKGHTFAQGDGPPPDPKYNFLADSDREESRSDNTRENTATKSRGKPLRGNMRKRGGGRDGPHRDNRTHPTSHRDEYQPEYDAWRAERNRIDEDRISRQRTAEGNWRREWDNNKMHMVDDISKRESRATFGDAIKRDKHFDGRHHSDGHEHMNYNRGASQRSRGPQRNFYGNHDYRYNISHDEHGHVPQTSVKNAAHVGGSEERTVVATEKSIKVTLNQSPGGAKGQVTSIKVNSSNIAGTGRVGPRQKSRVTYSSQSDFETSPRDPNSFVRQKSFEDKSKGSYSNTSQKTANVKKVPTQRKKESTSKSPYSQRKEFKTEQNKNPKEPLKSPDRQEDANVSSAQHTEIESKEVTNTSANDVVDENLSIKETVPIPVHPSNSENSKEGALDMQIEESNMYSTTNNHNASENSAEENQVVTDDESSYSQRKDFKKEETEDQKELLESSHRQEDLNVSSAQHTEIESKEVTNTSANDVVDENLSIKETVPIPVHPSNSENSKEDALDMQIEESNMYSTTNNDKTSGNSAEENQIVTDDESSYSQRKEFKKEETEDQKEPLESAHRQENSNVSCEQKTKIESEEVTDTPGSNIVDKNLSIKETVQTSVSQSSSENSKEGNIDMQIEESNMYPSTNNGDDSNILLDKVNSTCAVSENENVIYGRELDNSTVSLEKNKVDVPVTATCNENIVVDVDVTTSICPVKVEITDNYTKDNTKGDKHDIEKDSSSKEDQTTALSTEESSIMVVSQPERGNQLFIVEDVETDKLKNDDGVSNNLDEMQQLDKVHVDNDCDKVKQNIVKDDSNKNKENALCDVKVAEDGAEDKTAQSSKSCSANEDISNVSKMTEVLINDIPKEINESEECRKCTDNSSQPSDNTEMNDNANIALIDKN